MNDIPPPRRTSTGRVIWIIWCLTWAGAWLVALVLSIPAGRCIFAVNGTCQGSYTSGNWGAVLLSAVAFILSLLAARLPVGKEHR